MGNLAIISDLHADINQLGEPELGLLAEVLEEKRVTHLHLAGDTGNSLQLLLDTVHFFETRELSVSYNFGNHEMPDLPSAEIEDYSDSRFLNGRPLDLSDSLALLAFNGWYDYSFYTEKSTEKILAAKNLYWYDRAIQRNSADPAVNQEILEKLAPVLDQLKEDGKKVIIATHFVPKKEFIVYQNGRYQRFNELNAFLGSEKTGALFDGYSNIRQVVFGHTHRRFEDKKIKGKVYTCRPFGYYFEWWLTRNFVLDNQLAKAFNPMKVRQILKEHSGAYMRYRYAHLKEEYRKALTVVRY